ncbi:MAG: YkvA family protein [Acidobacteriota bacterium]|nr:YkvA family protein [Acidobacteriota bacterium]
MADKVKVMAEPEIRAALEREEREASRLFTHTRETTRLLQDAVRKSERNRNKLLSFWRDLSALLRLLRAWKNKTYTKLPKKTIIMVLAAVIYFVDPFDLIPDVIPILGYIDDAAVLGLVMASIRDDLERFQEWEGTIQM